MRIAFVQGAPGLEAVEKQADRLRSLTPDRYQIEAHPTASARQRLIELLDGGLHRGDELCLASLEPLRLDAGETAQALTRLLDRGANVLLLQDGQPLLDMAKSSDARRLLEALATVHRHWRPAATPKGSATPKALLSDAEIEDVRRLAEAGLSPRRIGLIYQRSPKCISDLLWTGIEATAGPSRRRA